MDPCCVMDQADVHLERERSKRFVAGVFGAIATAALMAFLAIKLTGDMFGLTADEAGPMAQALLILAIADTTLMFVWDWVFSRRA